MPRFVACLPRPLRVRAARRAVARLKHGESGRGAPRAAALVRPPAALDEAPAAAPGAALEIAPGAAPRERIDPLAGVLLAAALLCSAALGVVATEAPPTLALVAPGTVSPSAVPAGSVADRAVSDGAAASETVVAGADPDGRDRPVLGAALADEPSPFGVSNGTTGPAENPRSAVPSVTSGGDVVPDGPASSDARDDTAARDDVDRSAGTDHAEYADHADRDETDRAGQDGPLDRDGPVATGAESVTADAALAPPVADALWSEIGRVQAEILRLRVLFRRLADVAELENGEFDLELAPTELPAVREALDAREALDLSIRALDPISEQSARMASIFDERRAAHDRRVGGRVAKSTVRTSGFGQRISPLDGVRRPHRGIDLAGRPGTPIHALADGIVTWSGLNGAYGNLVEIEHGDGFRTRYAHNRRNLVALGERVRKGEVVATLGSSGRSSGPHVHVEVRRHGRPLDPERFVR